MKLMLDTNICIYLIKEHPASVLDRFIAHPVGDIGVSVITLAELEYGVAKSSQPARNRAALEQLASPLEVAAFDRDATAVYGRLRATLEKKGQPIGSMDLLIAAHAISLDVRLITHNVREFGKVPGLRIEDWT
jgi:tRNA(fMet)-specific endonuclease VapC